MTSEKAVREAAQALADALDGNDFDAAAKMLAASCRYDLPAASLTDESVLVGPDAILESYSQPALSVYCGQ